MRLNVTNKLISRVIGNVKKNVLSYVKKYSKFSTDISKPNKIIVAVSGGQDSIALLGILYLLSSSLNLEIIVCHINHGLRKESEDEAVFVKELCEKLKIKCFVYELNLSYNCPDLANNARFLRKKYFGDLAAQEKTNLIVIGHTKTDQTETILMHMIRGAGIKGMEGMKILDFPYLRPFLNITRAETKQICEILKLKFVSDCTNTDTDQLRIALRENIIPQFEKFNPNVQDAFSKLGIFSHGTNQLIIELSNEETRKRFIGNDIAGKQILGGIWNTKNYDTSINILIRFQFLRNTLITESINSSDVRLETIQNIDDHIINKKIGQFNLPNRMILKIDPSRNIFYFIKNRSESRAIQSKTKPLHLNNKSS